MNDKRIEINVSVPDGCKIVAGWMSFGIIPATSPVPEFASGEMTNWVSQRISGDNPSDPQYRLATLLKYRSYHGQVEYMPSKRLVINAILTDPSYQRMGIADELLKRAVEYDGSTDAIWVQTLPEYEGLFRRNEFHVVMFFGVDLNYFDWEQDPAREFGIQKWSQMKKEAGTVWQQESMPAEASSDEESMPAEASSGEEWMRGRDPQTLRYIGSK